MNLFVATAKLNLDTFPQNNSFMLMIGFATHAKLLICRQAMIENFSDGSNLTMMLLDLIQL